MPPRIARPGRREGPGGSAADRSGARPSLRRKGLVGGRHEDCSGRPAMPCRVPSREEAVMPLDEYRAKRDFRGTREPSGEPGADVKARVEAGRSMRAVIGLLRQVGAKSEVPALLAKALEYHEKLAGEHPDDPDVQDGLAAILLAHGDHLKDVDGRRDDAERAFRRSLATRKALADGRLEFALHGEKLRGAFALIRMKARGRGKPQWLLVKKQDEFAAVGPPEAGGTDEAPPPRSRARSGKAIVQPSPASAPPEAIELTHGDKLMYPEAGLTKADVFAYYRKVAPRLLPFLKDRPITLERLPDGLSGPDAPHFWQKD
ncbi:hypothetical protein HK102_012015, partial [Quaeritorhiza haematococci]